MIAIGSRLITNAGLRPAEWWSFLDTVQVSYLIMLP